MGLMHQSCLVFDSGIGGMGVVQALQSLKPELVIDYLADTALYPYGEQPDDLLIERIVRLIHAAYQQLKPDIVVIACNTASTLALPAVRAALPVPIIGCVPPIRWAGRVSKTRTIGLFSTSATARRPYVQQLHADFAADCRLIVHGARQLADLAEQAFLGKTLNVDALQAELSALFAQPGGTQIDTIGLGCTHYTFLLPELASYAPQAITWLDPAPAVARHALTILEELSARAPCERLAALYLTAPPQGEADFSQAIRRLRFEKWDMFETHFLNTQSP
ncbi:glutamate racemase [Neokomagataea anthophila]|uniref:Glutamate racemase n=1 Tax=Neokomagataea anthophila TaxID=2826925 RepID=A0ABS5E4X9_9PROT|nr:glutamate racemase [Neokomagataea anthophila]MBR0558921.1 glutamate racemase [Neokomagataea anthophila]